MPRALIIGRTGLIGRATARRLLQAGWDVDVTGRNPVHSVVAGARFLNVNRANLGSGADLLVDCVCYTADDARSLLPLVRDSASSVMISSKAVYVDEHGNHSNSTTAPRFNGPIPETQPTLPPGFGDFNSRYGYGPNKIAANTFCSTAVPR